MKNILIIIFSILFSKLVFSDNLFETDEYILKFNSENINIIKEKNIDDIKIKSFQSILKKILTKNNYKKIQKNLNIQFVNNFILNMTINQENIVNNNYYSIVKINFNKDTIIDYFIMNKISYVETLPRNLLIIIYEQNNLENNLLSKKNSFYKYLLNTEKEIFSSLFLLPNLDFNDRYIFNKNHFKNKRIEQIKKLNYKYNTNYQILVHSSKKNNFYHIKTIFIDKDKEYLIEEIKLKKLNFKEIYLNIYYNSLDKWKELNQIDTKFTNALLCKININNIHELKFVRNLLKSNRIIKSLNLNSIMLNENIYNILYFGNFEIFRQSLQKDRLNINIKDNECNIKLI